MSPSRNPALHGRALPRRPARAGFALLLVWVLLAAQGLGLWHRAEHAPRPGWAAEIHGAAAPASADHADPPHATEHLFGHAAGDLPQCRLFDQLGLADALLAVAAPLPAVEPVRAVVLAPAEGVAQVTAPSYRARAPPVFG